MKKVLTAEEMRQTERAYFETGVSSRALMERAAACLCEELIAALGEAGKTCVFACGPGGNGGDGYAAARIFAEKGGRAILLPVYPPRTEDTIANYRRALPRVFACASLSELDALPLPDAWADCIFGIGVSRAVDGDCARAVARMNGDKARGAKLISADIPTGLNADTGEIIGACARADITICFQALKRGHLLGQGLYMCGRTVVRSLGIPEACLPKDAMRLVAEDDLPAALPARPRTAHKNTFGHLLIFAGSRGMAGAAAICALAAMRTGAGLTTVACPESILPILQTLAPCAMGIPLPEENGAVSAEARGALSRALESKTAIAAGPGLSLHADPGCVEILMKSGLPSVFDADALNLISASQDLPSYFSPMHAVTPHPGEAARLTREPRLGAAEAAQRLHALGCAALVKGAATVICDDNLYVSVSGCAGMAKGGSGDALTGIIGALLAQGVHPGTALWLGSELHGRAGEIAAARAGEVSMLPLDLVSAIGEAFPHARA